MQVAAKLYRRTYFLECLRKSYTFAQKDAVINMLRRYISGYDKSGTFLKKQHWVAEMSTDDRQSEACNRATILGQDSESYTEIHRAIKLFTDTK